MEKPLLNDLVAEAAAAADLLDDVAAAKLARTQVILVAQLVLELRELVKELRKQSSGTTSSFTAEDAARVLGDEFPGLDESTYVLIAKLARDQKRLERALARVREAEDVKNPVGLLIRILQKWSA